MLDYYEDELFEDPGEFIDYFIRHDYLFSTGNKFEANLPGKGGWIFRGQSDSSWGLMPSAFRNGSLNGFSHQPPSKITFDRNIREYLGDHLLAEAKSVYLFLEAADMMGIPNPLDYAAVHHALEQIFLAITDREETYDYSSPFPPEALHRATALAQHHGVPTRFLDWSESPLVACYFAAFDASSFSNTVPAEGQEISVIYVGSNSLLNKSSPVQIIMTPRHESPHLRQQKGVFTTIRHANQFFLENRRWPTLHDFQPSQFQLFRARLPATKADELLKILFDLDITRHSLMPTLDHAAKAYNYVEVLFGKNQHVK